MTLDDQKMKGRYLYEAIVTALAHFGFLSTQLQSTTHCLLHLLNLTMLWWSPRHGVLFEYEYSHKQRKTMRPRLCILEIRGSKNVFHRVGCPASPLLTRPV